MLPLLRDDRRAFAGDGDHDLTHGLKLLRVLRVLRLGRLLELFKGSRVATRLRAYWGIDYEVLVAARIFGLVLLFCHFTACALMVQTFFLDNVVDSWLGRFGYCEDDLEAYPCGDASVLYTACFYWAVMVVAGVGNSPPVYERHAARLGRAVAVREIEMWVTIAIVLMGAMLWANAIAYFCALVASSGGGRGLIYRFRLRDSAHDTHAAPSSAGAAAGGRSCACGTRHMLPPACSARSRSAAASRLRRSCNGAGVIRGSSSSRRLCSPSRI